jgi:N-acetylneuraminate synthase
MQNNMIIAEIGSVHDGSFGNAINLIKLAAECGATAVKFQTHIAEAETIANAPSPKYFRSESRIDYFKRTSFTSTQWMKLKETANECNVLFLSSPFSLEAVDVLEELGMDIYKIPSGEVTNIPLLEKIADLGKPVLLSSGMSNFKELDKAYEVFSSKCELTILQCSSAYPCPNNEVGLNVIDQIKKRYNCKAGYSDHTLGFAAPIAAAALGAVVIEKHFTFSNRMYGSDAVHSMEPSDFKILSKAIKDVWEMLSNPVDKQNLDKYSDMKDIFQKSIVATSDIPSGTIIQLSHLSFKKPGTGIPAGNYKNLIGKVTNKNFAKDELFDINYIS